MTTLTKTISSTELWEKVKEVAAERPDYIYDHRVCQYAYNGQPACIVGHALVRCGAPIEFLEKLDAEHDGTGISVNGIFNGYSEYLVDDDWSARHRIQNAQERQDHGSEWGVAVEV